jgi:inhibitor of KinA
MMSPRLLDVGDGAVTVEFGDRIAPELVACVAALEAAVDAARARGELPGVVETMPTFRSLTVIYDALATCRADIDTVLLRLLSDSDVAPAASARRWKLPVCYGGTFGADLSDVAAATGLAADEVIALHAATEFRVAMIGFMPGFPFLGGLPAALKMPRRREPRVRVPAGSVAITGPLSAVYPWESPGGWQLIGRCPVPLFDPSAAEAPSLLMPGDIVRFEPVAEDRYAALAAEIAAGRHAFESWRDEAR